MDRALKTWELSLLFGILLALVAAGWLGQEQTELAESVIRFHVIANSDEVDDQTLKLAVRDEILTALNQFYPQNATLEEAEDILLAHLDEIQAVGQAVVDEAGANYTVSAEVAQSYFPTKDYENFSLPAGAYTALRVTLGTGAGENWWCVAFPPLCLGVTSMEVEAAQAAGLFTDDQLSLITQDSQGYVLKFKGMELLGEAKEWLTS